MHVDTPLISTVIGGIALAFIFGTIAQRLRLLSLVGYLMTGVVAGPFTPGFVADQSLTPQLAELGVILLIFGVGLHFSMKKLLAVKAIAIPDAIGQIALTTLMGMGLAWLLGWDQGPGPIFSLALSVASTVVLLKALEGHGIDTSYKGHIAVGWLVVGDLVIVATLMLLPALAGALGGAGSATVSTWGIVKALTIMFSKVVAFAVLMLVVGRRMIPWMLERIVMAGSQKLLRLGVPATALGVAYGATVLFGVSFALSAFFTGMILAESEFSQRVTEGSLPLRNTFAMLSFVSMGILFDPSMLIEDPWAVLDTVLIVVIGKSLAAFAMVRAFGHSNRTTLTISASLAQTDESSFILIGLGISLEILPDRTRGLLLTATILSILLNPLIFVLINRLRRGVTPEPTTAD